ncbi:MAG TPA: hypothetical protein VE959_34380 [Bryobacteraceae bacterium]|nr:hypothetical protein [Bryobacteraceae bacterium]
MGTGAVGAAGQGRSIALTSDGATLLVGGPGDNGGAGAAWVFTRTGNQWTQRAKLVGTGVLGSTPAAQGTSVALSSDGTEAFVGGPGDNGGVGAVWWFTRNAGGAWSQKSKVVATPAPEAGTRFGSSVALSQDGLAAFIGGPGKNAGAGAVWAFVFDATAAVLLQSGPVTNSDAVGNAQQGSSATVDGAAVYHIAGGPQDSAGVGAAWVYTGGEFNFGLPVALAEQGKLVGTGGVGASQQGSSVVLSLDANTALVGGPQDNSGAGAVWAFTRGFGYTQQGGKLTGSGAAGAAAFGSSVALSADSGTAVVGGPADASGSGAAWVFTLSGATWIPTGNKLTGSGAQGAAQQGASVAASNGGAIVVVGGPADSGGAGAVWVFAVPPAIHFDLSVPVSATAGSPVNFTVTAADASDNEVAGFSGTLHFTSTDSAAVLPADSTLNGAGTFTATLETAGIQTITATGKLNTSFTGTSGPISVIPPGGNGTPAPVSVVPAAGSASSQTFAFAFLDTAGSGDLGVLNILINNFLDGRHACYLAYSQPLNVLYLVDDLGGTLLGGTSLASGGSVANSQCNVSWGSSAVARAGANLTLTLTIAFTNSFAGNRIIYMAARNLVETNSGWQPLGVANVPGAVQATTTAVVSMSPSSGSGFGPAPFTFSFSDTKGFQDFGVLNVLVNNALDGRHACYLAYSRPTNILYLVDDAGDGGGPFAGSAVLSGAGSIQNSQCAVSWGAAPVAAGGNGLTLALNIGFTAALGGNRIFYLAARDVNDLNNTGWQAMGTWMVH